MTDSNNDSEFDPRAFRRALGNFATGVTVITAKGVTEQSPDGVNVGVTASSFNSLSMDPPLVLWSSIKASPSCAIFESASHFAVNILASDQMHLSNHFARQQEDKFATVDWQAGLGDAPLLPNCAGRFQCETYDKVDGGDHWIFIGKVIAFDDFGRSPLCFHQGAYSMVSSHPGNVKKDDVNLLGNDSGKRMGEHAFFLMLQAVRAYQDSYQPKLAALNLNLIESRALLVLSDLTDLDGKVLSVHLNAPAAEVNDALLNLIDLGMIRSNSEGRYALTQEGREKSAACWNLSDSHALAAFNDFSDEQINNFKDVLRHIISH